MNIRFFALLVVIATVLVPTVVGAQETGNGSTEGSPVIEVSMGAPQTHEEPPREQVDNLTAIESARFEDGEMELVLYSKIPQRVTLTDAGAVFSGGTVPQRTVYLDEGRNRVSIPVTEVSGRVAVTVSTRNVLYAKTMRTGTALITGPYSKEDVQNAALAGITSGLGITGLIAYRRVRGLMDRPERIL